MKITKKEIKAIVQIEQGTILELTEKEADSLFDLLYKIYTSSSIFSCISKEDKRVCARFLQGAGFGIV